jgi:integrase
MASLAHDSNGKVRVILLLPDRRRAAIRLGKVTQLKAETSRVHIERLASAKWDGGERPEPPTLRWLAGIGDKLHEKLAKLDLVEPRKPGAVATLTTLLDDFYASRTVKPTTIDAYKATGRNLLAYFTADRDVRDIGPDDAEKFRQHLRTEEKLSPATVGKRIKVARQVFRAALRWRRITENPFAEVQGGSQKNKDRMYYVSREVVDKVLEKCPDAEWRLLVSLSRFGGLRCPSESLALTWQDIDWEKNRVRVSSCKTEAHAGKDCRFIPMFPELAKALREFFEPVLQDSLERGVPMPVHVITRYRDTRQNLRTQLNRIVGKAGLKPWPKLWHNMRSSRQTELTERYPIHVVCAWLGNSTAVAADHYLQVRDEYFSDAVGTEEKAAHFAARPTVESGELAGNATEEKPVCAASNGTAGYTGEGESGPGGLEPPQADPESAVLPLHQGPMVNYEI